MRTRAPAVRVAIQKQLKNTKMNKIGLYVFLLIIGTSCSRRVKVNDVAFFDNYIINNNNILLFLTESDSLLEFRKIIYEDYCSTMYSISYSDVENRDVIGYCNSYRKNLIDSVVINDFASKDVKFVRDAVLYSEEVSVYQKERVVYFFFKERNVVLVSEEDEIFDDGNICKEVLL